MKTCIALLLALVAAPLSAQRIAETRAAFDADLPAVAPAETPVTPSAIPDRPIYSREPTTGYMVATGSLFMVGGMFAGAIVGRELEQCEATNDYCGDSGAILGLLAGQILGVAMGVHVASDRSSLLAKMRGSAAMFLAGALLTPVTGGVSFLAIPPAQLAYIIGIEKRAMRQANKP